MEHTKKKRIKQYISWVCVCALVALLATMPLLARSGGASDGPQASILTGTVEPGSISTALHGGGTLTEEEAVEVTIPSGVKLTQFLVKNGDTVAAGDALASVDRVSVMSAVTKVQETLDHLREQIAEASGEEEDGEIVTTHDARVKLVYAREGDSVQSVMLEHGALAVLSLDGMMAVELDTNQGISTGDAVTVTFSDGTAVTGRVDSALDGKSVITVDDQGYALGETVKVTAENGRLLGSGELYVHNAWKAVAYSGVVEEVSIEAEETVSADDTLFTLTDTDSTGKLQSLAAQHREYEALMLELFRLYQDTTITAPCDGVVSGVDEESIHLLSDSGEGWTLELLANAPNGDDDIAYSNFVGIVTGFDAGAWNLALNPQNLAVSDYKVLSGMAVDPAAMTQVASFVPGVPVYELVEGQWQQISPAAVAVGDTLLFAGDAAGNFVWVVRLNTSTEAPAEPTTPTMPSIPGPDILIPTEPTADPTDPTVDSMEPTEESTEPSTEATTPSIPSENIQIPGMEDALSGILGGGSVSGSMGGSFSGIAGGYTGGMDVEEETFELYELEGSVIAGVTPQNTVTLSITLDERDIGKISLGQTADVRVEALKNETFTAQVTKIATTGTNNGGNSKFTVELTMDRGENMLAGMNATAKIVLSTVEDVLTVPVAALVEQGARTVVYTGYDEETGELTKPVEVTTGISDGENTQILSGLEAGESFRYAYYDTLEISHEVESNSFAFGG